MAEELGRYVVYAVSEGETGNQDAQAHGQFEREGAEVEQGL